MERLIQEALSAMVTYETGSPKRIQHFIKVYTFSKLIGLREGLDPQTQLILETTAAVHDIGIRKSLGGKQRDIRSQFIIEAGTTSAIGGLLGIAFGCLVAMGVGTLIGGALVSQMGGNVTFSATPTFSAVAVSFGVSVGIGVLFGYLPANKAAKLNPIDALRYE